MTAEQLLATPGLGRCELVRGELIMMTPAGFEHGCITAELCAHLSVFVRQKKLGQVTGAETGFQIARDPDTVRAPDVGFIRAQRVPPVRTRGFFPGPPDLAVEVLSPDDRASEVLAKVNDWLRDDSRITSPFGKGTVPFSLRENRDSPQLVLASSLTAGSLAVWVVDPAKRTVCVYPKDGQTITWGVADELSGGDLLPGFRLPIAEIFAG